LACGAGGGLPSLAPAAGGQPGAPAPAGGPAIDPGLSLQDLLNMWLFNFGTGLDSLPVADAGVAPTPQALQAPQAPQIQQVAPGIEIAVLR
jgi:hypothetical protein